VRRLVAVARSVRWLAGATLAYACSLQVPDEEELFSPDASLTSGGAGGSAGDASAGSGGSSGSAGGDAAPDQSSDGASDAGGDASDAAGDAAVEPHRGIILHYKFDETDGDIVHDQTDSTKNGRIIGAPSWITTGKIGGAVQLSGGKAGDSGAQPPYVELPRNVLLTLSATTIATWFRWDGGDGFQRLFDLGSGLPSWIYFSPYGSGGPQVGVHKLGQPDDYFDVFIAKPTSVGTWTHVAITWNADRLDVYIDGVRVGGRVPPVAPLTDALITPADLGATTQNWIGRSQFTPPAAFNDPFYTGMVDDFRIYDRVLSVAEVAALHAYRE